MSKIDGYFSKKNHLRISIQETIFCKKKYLTSISEPLHFLKLGPIFDKLALPVFSKQYNGFLWPKIMLFRTHHLLKFHNRTDISAQVFRKRNSHNMQQKTFLQLNCIQFQSLAALLIMLRRSRYFRRKKCPLIGLRQNQKRQKMLIFDTICTTLSSPLSVLFYQTTWSEFFQRVSFKQPGPSQKKWIVLFYFRAAMANLWSLLNNLV